MTTGSEVELYEDLELERHLMVAVERAAANAQTYTILACVPQRLPGEDISDVVATVAQYATEIVRPGDVVGLLDAEVIILGLQDTGPNQARVFAHRLAGDLRLHSQRMRNTVWETGYSCLPDNAESAEELLLEAVENAITRRRRLGG
jgi:hypothetical protein